LVGKANRTGDRHRTDARGGGVGVEDIALRRPTLDEVFLNLTGHATTVAPERVSA
jgi:hypothetical protein